LIPQTTLNLLCTAIGHHRLELVRYLLVEWQYKHLIVKNQCIYHPKLPHQLPPLLYTILDCHLRFIGFTCDVIELFFRHYDAMDIGLNWVCNKLLREQPNIVIGDIEQHPCCNERMLYINRTLSVGSMLAALTYKCQALWQSYQAYDTEQNELKLGIQRLITILVENGIDWNLAKFDCRVKNIILKYVRYPIYNVIDMNRDICDDQEFVRFFQETVSDCVGTFRQQWLTAFLSFYRDDTTLANIFKWYVLDFVVPRSEVLDSIKYFTIKTADDIQKEKTDEEKDDSEENANGDMNNAEYVDWDNDPDVVQGLDLF